MRIWQIPIGIWAGQKSGALYHTDKGKPGCVSL